jgi:hypothetical protein
VQPEDLFASSPVALAVLRVVMGLVDELPEHEVRTTKSQVAFRRRRGFAYLWRPGQYLAKPGAEIVLSVLLERRDPSPRWKEVVRTSPARWIHHLEVHDPAEVDDEVVGWLTEAADLAG